jgi:heat shock protein HslJ
MNMTTMTTGLATLALGGALAACSSPAPGNDPAATRTAATTPAAAAADPQVETEAEVPPALVGRWNLVAIEGTAVVETGRAATLEMAADGSAGGVGGVNRFRTRLAAADGRLVFGETAATKMAGPPAAMELEQTYLSRLPEVDGFSLEGDTLRLMAGESEVLRFQRAEE